MRVCQPGPEAFHRAKTSGGSLSEIDVVGAADLGRPRGRSIFRATALPKISGRTPRAGRASRNSLAVHGGLSGSIGLGFWRRGRGMETYLSLVRCAKTDDVMALIARREHQHVEPTCYRAEHLEIARILRRVERKCPRIYRICDKSRATSRVSGVFPQLCERAFCSWYMRWARSALSSIVRLWSFSFSMSANNWR